MCKVSKLIETLGDDVNNDFPKYGHVVKCRCARGQSCQFVEELQKRKVSLEDELVYTLEQAKCQTPDTLF